MLDDSVFDRPLLGRIHLLLHFLLVLPGLKKQLEQSPVLPAGFGEFV